MNLDAIQKIKEAYENFKSKLDDIRKKKTSLLKTYRAKIEEEKIKEIQSELKK